MFDRRLVIRAVCLLLPVMITVSAVAAPQADVTGRSGSDEQQPSVRLSEQFGGASRGSDAESEAAADSAFGPVLRVLGIYSIIIAAASLFGGWLPGRVRFSHLQFQLLLSMVGGMLLGIGVFHLLAHAFHQLGGARIDLVTGWLMAGIVLMFFLLRAFHVHHHEPAGIKDVLADSGEAASHEAELPVSHAGCDHDHHHHDSHDHGHAISHSGSGLGWTGMLFGLGIHTLLDGVALGAAMQADAQHGARGWLGLGVLTGIVLHKPLDSLSITTMMQSANRPLSERVLVNLAYCVLCPLGAFLFVSGMNLTGTSLSIVVGCSLAFSAGIFICIALADLLPEMEFHSHHRWQLTAFLIAGIVLAWAIRFLEPAHMHG